MPSTIADLRTWNDLVSLAFGPELDEVTDADTRVAWLVMAFHGVREIDDDDAWFDRYLDVDHRELAQALRTIGAPRHGDAIDAFLDEVATFDLTTPEGLDAFDDHLLARGLDEPDADGPFQRLHHATVASGEDLDELLCTWVGIETIPAPPPRPPVSVPPDPLFDVEVPPLERPPPPPAPRFWTWDRRLALAGMGIGLTLMALGRLVGC